MPDSVFELLRAAAEAAGEEPAVTYGDQHLTWRQLETLARRCAGGLVELGVGEGDRVAFWLPNTTAYIALYFACAQIGAIAVAVNTRFRAKEVADILRRSRAETLILWPEFRGIDFMSILDEMPADALTRLHTVIVYGEDDKPPGVPAALAQTTIVSYDDVASHSPCEHDAGGPELGCNMFTTSGTTSAPKFVLHRQRSVTAHARELWADMAPIVGGGALLQTLPFCGVFGFTSIILAVAGRVHMIVTSAFDPAEAVRLVDEHRVRYLNATDDMLMAMLEADARERALPGLVCCGFGAFNAAPEEIAERASARGLNLIGLYGMSEVMALFARRAPAENPARRILGGGTLVSPAAEVRVRHPDTGELCPHGEEGELEIKGPSLMSEYFENPEATSAALTDDGYLRTGDMGYTTGPREFVYLARMGDTLRLGGFLVSPVEIEAHLAEHASVAGAQVVSVRAGDATRAYAFIVPAEGHSVDEARLQAHCSSALARFKVPIRYQSIAEFPTTRSANGTKIQRTKLREAAQQAVDAQFGRATS